MPIPPVPVMTRADFSPTELRVPYTVQTLNGYEVNVFEIHSVSLRDRLIAAGHGLDAVEMEAGQLTGLDAQGQEIPVDGARAICHLPRTTLIGLYVGDEFPDMAAFDTARAADPKRAGTFAFSFIDGRVIDASHDREGVCRVNMATMENARAGIYCNAVSVELRHAGVAFAIACVASFDIYAGQGVYMSYGEELCVNDTRLVEKVLMQLYYTIVDNNLQDKVMRRYDALTACHMNLVYAIAYPKEYVAPHVGKPGTEAFRVIVDPVIEAICAPPPSEVALREADPLAHAKLFWKKFYGCKSTRFTRVEKRHKNPLFLRTSRTHVRFNPNFIPLKGHSRWARFAD